MAKRVLSSTDAFDLRQALHVAVLEALLASRRWAPGDLMFQGGTSLHLVHGSPRFSEDLDFLVKSSLPLGAIEDAIQTRLSHTPWLPKDVQIKMTKAKLGHNPHAFVVAASGPTLIGGVRVKVELWQAPVEALSALRVVVAPVRVTNGPAAGAQAFVPTLELAEIYTDKVFALVARPYLKPRDVFDLDWLRERGVPAQCSANDLRHRLAAYPNEAPRQWIKKAKTRRQELAASGALVLKDLRRWLPSTWPLDAAAVQRMLAHALAALDDGVERMQEIGAAARSIKNRPDDASA